MRILSTLKKFAREFPGHFIATCLTLLILSATGAYAASSYDVTNEPTMFLRDTVGATDTTIVLSAPQLNSADHVFGTLTGGVLRIRSGVFKEDFYYAQASVNATTYEVTLTGIIRNLCPQVTRTYVSCGNGRRWGNGAFVELIQDARLFNLKANVDRANNYTASGAAAFYGSGSLAQPTFATTAERDRQMGATPGGPVRAACVTATGLCYDYIAGSWTARTGGSVANASTTVAGKIQIANTNAQKYRTATGSTGAQNVVSVQTLTMTGGTSARAWMVPILNSLGLLDSSVIPPSAADVLVFGGASDGNLILTQNTTMTANKQYNTVYLNGFTLSMSGYILQARTVSGSGKVIAPPGLAGANGTAAVNHANGTGAIGGAVAIVTHSFPGTGTGAKGGNGAQFVTRSTDGVQAGTAGSNGRNANPVTLSLSGTTGTGGALGGAGGNGTTTQQGLATGGASGTIGTNGSITSAPRLLVQHYLQWAYNVGTSWFQPAGAGPSTGSAGGGSGGFSCNTGGNSCLGKSGGGGGAGGAGSNAGNWVFAVKTISGTWTFEAKGGAGGTGGAGGNGATSGNASTTQAAGGGGGGGGGAGGSGGDGVWIVQNAVDWTGTRSTVGGAGGAGGAGGTCATSDAGADGETCTNGATGATGKRGQDGTVIVISF